MQKNPKESDSQMKITKCDLNHKKVLEAIVKMNKLNN